MKEAKSINQVGKRAKNSVLTQIKKLEKKYGERIVRLVSLHYFSDRANQNKLQKEIQHREEELNKLKEKL